MEEIANNLTQILLNAQSPDQALRQNAEQSLKKFEDANAAAFFSALAAQLADESKPADARRLAGLVLKNKLDAKDRTMKNFLKERWVLIAKSDEQGLAINNQIKANALSTLASNTYEARHTAAQVVAKIAGIELPLGMWNDLIRTLLSFVRDSQSQALQQASLESLGYICEEAYVGDLDAAVLSANSNEILTAVVQGMLYQGTGDLAPDVRLAAATALLNAIEFSHENFQKQEERDVIMKSTCEIAKSPDPRIRKVALECLVKVGENYYNLLPPYMPHLFELTVNAMKSDEEAVGLQAIEFWSTIAEEELAGIEDDAQNKEPQSIIVQARSHLCPVLFECLMQQEDHQDDDTWNKSTAAGACLVLIAEVDPNNIVNEVIPFVQKNISDQSNWRAREAATMAFGSILEGPEPSVLVPLIDSAAPVLLQSLMTDSNVSVRDTTAWTLGRMVLVSNEVARKYITPLVESLLKGLKDEAPVARNVCWAIHNIGEAFETESEEHVGTISQFCEPLLRGLLETTVRDDAIDSNLQASGYESLNMLFRSLPIGSIPAISQCVPILLERLEQTLTVTPFSEEDREELSEKQGLICGTLQTATQRLKGQGISPFADRMMQCYLQVFRQGNAASVHEEALMAVGAMADAVESQFEKYIAHFMPFLKVGLHNWEQYQVCSVAVGVVGDICRALERRVLPYTDDIVSLLLNALQNTNLDRSVKPPMLSCFGDIAMAIGGDFERYLRYVMDMLKQAAQSSVQIEISPDDYDLQDWVLSLRESIFEAYTGIIQGLRNDSKQELLSHLQQVTWILDFCRFLTQESNRPEKSFLWNIAAAEKLIGAAVGVLGDLVSNLEKLRLELVIYPWVGELISKGCQSKDNSVRETSLWAKQAIFAEL